VPTGAEVLVNGTRAGLTPATLPAQPSEQPLAIEVFLPGYRRFKQTATLRPTETRTVDTGTLLPESGGIELRHGNGAFRLPGAVIRVDGRAEPLTEGRLTNLEVGGRAIEITHRDYEPWRKTVTVRDAALVPTPVQLSPKPCLLSLKVTGPAAYTLTANGAIVPVKNGRATLPAVDVPGHNGTRQLIPSHAHAGVWVIRTSASTVRQFRTVLVVASIESK
jgi:hypothetical protein